MWIIYNYDVYFTSEKTHSSEMLMKSSRTHRKSDASQHSKPALKFCRCRSARRMYHTAPLGRERKPLCAQELPFKKGVCFSLQIPTLQAFARQWRFPAVKHYIIHQASCWMSHRITDISSPWQRSETTTGAHWGSERLGSGPRSLSLSVAAHPTTRLCLSYFHTGLEKVLATP